MKTMLKLLTLVKQYIPVIILAVIFGTLGHLCVVAIPVLGIGNAVNRWFPVYLLALLGLLRGVLHYAEQYCNHFLAFSILAKIREIVFRKLRSLGPAKMEVKDKGNLISLLTSDIELLEVFYAHTISPVCIAFLMTVSMFIFFFHFSWILALTALAFYLIVGVIIPFTVNASAVKLGTEHRREFGQMNSFVLDCIRGLLQSIQYGNGYGRLNQIKSKSDQLTETKRKVSYLDGLTAALSYLFLTLGAKLDADRNEIIEACKKAQIHNFISQLPDGYETEVAELGDNFSGGERQRLGLARAFLHGGDFMILDEPTSNLDSYNEHQIMAAVKKEAKKKSVIIVSHRDSTFEFADKVYKLKSKRKS